VRISTSGARSQPTRAIPTGDPYGRSLRAIPTARGIGFSVRVFGLGEGPRAEHEGDDGAEHDEPAEGAHSLVSSLSGM
jgi:hypothetical protein